jgi:hypothetical protein
VSERPEKTGLFTNSDGRRTSLRGAWSSHFQREGELDLTAVAVVVRRTMALFVANRCHTPDRRPANDGRRPARGGGHVTTACTDHRESARQRIQDRVWTPDLPAPARGGHRVIGSGTALHVFDVENVVSGRRVGFVRYSRQVRTRSRGFATLDSSPRTVRPRRTGPCKEPAKPANGLARKRPSV